VNEQTGFAPVNGTGLYYEVAGSGPALVFLHAFGCDRRLWDAQAAHFARRYRVVRYDARGYGKSDVPAGAPYAHGEDLRALLDHLDIPAAALCGSSMGGQNAIELALRYPARVRALVVVSASLQGFPFSREIVELFGALRRTARTAGVEAARQLFVESAVVGAAADTIRPMLADYSGWHWLNESPVDALKPPMMERLGEISVPTLAMIGEHDSADSRAAYDYFVERVPAAKRHVFPGVGHFANVEAPERFNALVEDFLLGAGL
jgi:pimeloyl-ACP methyl ester carboxylesterase